MPYTQREGVRIFFDTHGEGPPLLLCPGLGSLMEHWGAEYVLLDVAHVIADQVAEDLNAQILAFLARHQATPVYSATQ